MTTMQCPCCGSRVNRKTPIVDLNTNSISFGGTVKLTPAQAEIAHVMADGFEKFISTERLISAVYGMGNEPDCPDRVISVHICNMRPKLARVGLAIESRAHFTGGRRMLPA